MTTESRKGRGRRSGSGFRAWYALKDALAMTGGAVVLYHAYLLIEAYLHGSTLY